MRTGLRLVFAGLLGLSIAACAACDTTRIFRGDPDDTTSKPSEFVGSADPLKTADLESLWEAAETVLRMEGYSIDTTRTHYDKREMFTHWDTHLAPNRYEGKRHRAEVTFKEVPEGGWTVAVVVQMQHNSDIVNPSNAAQANWEDVEPNAKRANTILYKIESSFREPGGDDKEAKK